MFRFLKNNKNQRMIYGIGIILWIILWLDSFIFINEINLVIFSIQVIIPILLLIAQLIFNNKKIWIALIIYIGLFSLWIIKNMIFDILRDYSRDYSPHPVWTYERIVETTVMLLILLIVNWTFWKIKPLKR